MTEDLTTLEETIIQVSTFDGNIMFLSGINDLLTTIRIYKCKTLQWMEKHKPHYQKQQTQESETGIDGIVFAFVDGIAWAIPTKDFLDFKEMKAGFKLGFENGISYRESMKIGTKDATEYTQYCYSGFDTLTAFRHYQNTHFPQLYRVWEDQYDLLLPQENLPTPLNLYQYISLDIIGLGGFTAENPMEIENAYKCGFWKRSDYLEATGSGFQSAGDFFQAQKFNISSPEDLKLLQVHGIQTIEAWTEFKNLLSLIEDGSFSDAIGYYLQPEILKKPAGSKWALSTLQNLIKQLLIVPFRISQGPYFDFTMQESKNQKIQELTQHPDLLPHIIASSNTTIMRRHFSQKEHETAIIDVSNVVLHNNCPTDERKGDADLLVVIVEKLRELGIETIHGIADASIKSDLTKDELKKISNKLDNFRIVKPAEPADIYILAMVEDIPSVIISNDKFSDWKNERHPWRLRNLDRLLIQYVFLEDGSVSFGEKEAELAS